VTWTVTIATFIATILALVIVFLLYSYRERVRDFLRKGPKWRLGRRDSAKVSIELISIDNPSIREETFTTNVSKYGICALTKNRWIPDDTVEVRFLLRDLRTRGQITYCRPFHDAFIIGLRFPSPLPRVRPNSED
jgi:hypothetical protein